MRRLLFGARSVVNEVLWSCRLHIRLLRLRIVLLSVLLAWQLLLKLAWYQVESCRQSVYDFQCTARANVNHDDSDQ